MQDAKYQGYWDKVASLEKQKLIQEVAYWRSQALGLEYENTQLHRLIEHLLGLPVRSPTTGARSEDNSSVSESCDESADVEDESANVEDESTDVEDESEDVEDVSADGEDESEDLEDERVDAELTGRVEAAGDVLVPADSGDKEEEDYWKFVEISHQHRQNLKNSKTRTSKGVAPARVVGQPAYFEELKAEMAELYGELAEQVHETETAAQMRFDGFCDEKRARLWPALPIRLGNI